MLSASSIGTEEILKNHNKTDVATNKQYQFLTLPFEYFRLQIIKFNKTSHYQFVMEHMFWLRFKNLLLALMLNLVDSNYEDADFENGSTIM